MADLEKKGRVVTRPARCLILFLLAGGAFIEAPALSDCADEDKPVGAACLVDKECQSSFCDLDVCTDPAGQYGAVCMVAPLTADGLRDGKLNTCGAYVCADGRCRSCQTDDQCKTEYGVPRCSLHDTRPGRRCGG